jgi:hypothetical protein
LPATTSTAAACPTPSHFLSQIPGRKFLKIEANESINLSTLFSTGLRKSHGFVSGVPLVT